MAYSILNLPPLSLPNGSPPRLPRCRAELSISNSSSFRPPTRRRHQRKNHLRIKFPNPPPLAPLPELAELSSFSSTDSHALVVEVEAKEEPFAAFEIANPFPLSAAHVWFPGSVFGTAVRFAALLAIQTAVSIWYLSMEDVQGIEEERNKNQLGLVRKEKVMVVGEGKGMDVDEFDRMILEIRAMAREARDREGKDRLYGTGVGKEVGKDLGRKKKIIAGISMDMKEGELVRKRGTKKLKKLCRDARYLPEARGFGSSNRANAECGLDKGNTSEKRF